MNDKTYVIEEYKTEIAVEPYVKGKPLKLDREFQWYRRPKSRFYVGEPRDVYTESVASLIRTVKFAKENVCTKQFQIRYGTLAGGALSIAHEPADNKFKDLLTSAGQYAEEARKNAVEQPSPSLEAPGSRRCGSRPSWRPGAAAPPVTRSSGRSGIGWLAGRGCVRGPVPRSPSAERPNSIDPWPERATRACL